MGIELNKPYKALIRITVILFLFSLQTLQAATIHRASAPGNLESTLEIGCVDKYQLNNKVTPADLFKGLSLCIQQGNFDPGVFMFAIAGVYARFDTFRVSDITAHDAAKILPIVTFNSLDAQKASLFKARVGQVLGDNNARATICYDINRIGPPDYFPRYMLQHGTVAINDKNQKSNALVTPFDMQSAWKQALDGYLHCPGNFSAFAERVSLAKKIESQQAIRDYVKNKFNVFIAFTTNDITSECLSHPDASGGKFTLVTNVSVSGQLTDVDVEPKSNNTAVCIAKGISNLTAPRPPNCDCDEITVSVDF